MPQDDDKFVDTEEDLSADRPQSTLNAIAAFKLPPFWTSRPQLWFARIEAQFRTYRVVGDTAKFDQIISELNPEFLAQVADLVESPPADGKYQALKERLLSACLRSLSL